MGMLESKYYWSLDMVSPLMGIFADRFWDEILSALITRLFVLYVDLTQKAISYSNNPVIWNEQRLLQLDQMILAQRGNGTRFFPFHAFEL